MTVIADTAHDSYAILEPVADARATAVIPANRNRTQRGALHREAHATRNVVERFLGEVKALRNVLTSHDRCTREFRFEVIPTAFRNLLRGPATGTRSFRGPFTELRGTSP